MRKLLFLLVPILGVLLVVACSGQPTQVPNSVNTQRKPDQVLFSLDWVVYGRHAPYFTALDKGYYADENIAVNIIRGYSSTDTIKRVGSGLSQFGFADIGTLVLSRGNEAVPVKAIAVIYAITPHFLFCNGDLGIKIPKDLEGHTIGAPAGNSHRVLFPAFAQLNNVDANKVSWQTIDATVQMQTLFAKKVDCIPEYFVPLLQKQAADTNFTFSLIKFSDYGMNFYSNGLITNEDTLTKNPDLVRRFLRATLKGFGYAFDHPDEAVTILQKYYPEIGDKAIAIQEVMAVQRFALSDEAKAHGLGYMDPAKMKATRDLIGQAFQLKSDLKAEDLYTNEFLPAK